MTRAGTAAGALLRITGVLGLLVVVAVAVGALQANGWTTAWGFYGPLVGAGVLWCVAIWRGRHDAPLSGEGVAEAERLAVVVRQERSEAPGDRASRCTDEELETARLVVEEVLADLRRGRVPGATRSVRDLQSRARREGWYLTSPLRRQLEALVAALERQEGRRARRTWWQRSMTQRR